MRYFVGNKKGYTLMELLVTLGLLCLVMVPVMSFFLSNYRTYYRADAQIMTQGEAQKAINGLTDKVMEAKGIVALKDGSGVDVPLDDTTAREVSRVVFFDVVGNSYLIYEFRDGELRFGKSAEIGGTGTVVLAKHISRFLVEPVGGSFGSCRGVRVTVESEARKGEVRTELVGEVYFRNRGME